MPLDKEENYDKITLLNALMEQSAAVGCQREGMVRALSQDRSAGHSRAAREDRDGSSPLRWMAMRDPGLEDGVIRVVPWKTFFRP